jgi:hypothetical protein
LLRAVSTLRALVPPAGLYGVVGTGLLWDVSTLCAVVPPPWTIWGVVSLSGMWNTYLRCVRFQRKRRQPLSPRGRYGGRGGIIRGTKRGAVVRP